MTRRLSRGVPLVRVLSSRLRSLRQLFTEVLRVWTLWRSDNFRFVDYYQPGHYYSPIPDYHQLSADSERLFARSAREIPALELNTQAQLELVQQFSQYYAELPFPKAPTGRRRFHLDNEYFCFGDAIALYSFLRHFRPAKVVEVGSGFSSALMLDVNDLYFAGRLGLTFIEPDPQRLFSLFTAGDRGRCEVVAKPVQQVPAEVFDRLGENDILFIDSSHVAKAGSDVVYLVSQILPALQAGVLIHFHDVFWPFEYPRTWFASGRAWNEAYFVKVFLQYNRSFKVLYFNSYLEAHYAQLLQEKLPLALQAPTARLSQSNASLWLRKVAQ